MTDALINGLAGAGAGIVAQLTTYPLQTVNTRQQMNHNPTKKENKVGTLEQIRQLVEVEGWTRLYSGLGPSLFGTAASQGVYYFFYQIFRNKAEVIALDRRKRGLGDGSVGMLSSLLVAAMSGCTNVLLTNPIWVVVIRMQTHTKLSDKSASYMLSPEELRLNTLEKKLHPYGTSRAIGEVYDEAGFWGFWKGVIPTLMMVSNPSMQFMLYETLLKKLRQKRALNKNGSKEVNALEIFLLGALAKLGATVVTYPLLVVKARLQAKQIEDFICYKGTIDTIMKIIQYEGFSGFYKGMSTKIVQSVLAAAILFMTKEEIVKSTSLFLKKNGSLSKSR